MINKLAKLKYLANNFEIVEDGDHVICAISQKKIPLENLTYWNVEEQEAYFSFISLMAFKVGSIIMFKILFSKTLLIKLEGE